MKVKLYVDDVLRETTTGKTVGVYDSETMTLERYTEDDTGKLIKATDHEETMDKTDIHGGLDRLFDRDSPTPEEEPTPKEVVEKETVMSKLKGSVNVPEEFKFADDNTFYTM